MKYLNKLPGYASSPSGYEWILLKKLPSYLAFGTAVPCLIVGYLYFYSKIPHAEMLKTIYLAIGIVFNLWFFVGTIAIGCVIVILMKGPAYVADPYELPEENLMREDKKG
jgi:hypothetical protein